MDLICLDTNILIAHKRAKQADKDKDLKQKRLLIEAEDLFIGATALHNRLKLATGNLRHFERLVGLEFVPVQ